MDIQEILAVVGDLELARRQQAQRVLELEARIAELENEISRREDGS